MRAIFLLLAACAVATAEPLQQPTPQQGKVDADGKFAPASPPASGLKPNPRLGGRFIIAEHSPTELAVGRVRIDREARTLSFPVEVAVRDQVLEYLLVHEMGKTHESLLSTSVTPQELHLAALILDVVGKSPTLRLSWKKNGPDADIALTDLLAATDDSPSLAQGKWLYQKALYDSRGLVAQREGSFISIIRDPASLLSHPAAAALGKDDVYKPRNELLPAGGVKLRLTLDFSE